MSMDAGTLYAEIVKVCPVVSVTVGTQDRSTWGFVPKPEATPAQQAAAYNVINSIEIKPLAHLGET